MRSHSNTLDQLTPVRIGRFWYVRTNGTNFQPFLTRREAREFARRFNDAQSPHS